MQAIGQAYHWLEQLGDFDDSPSKLAKSLGISNGLIRKHLKLTQLSPRILHMALAGKLPPSITLADLRQTASLLDWQKQAVYLRLDQLPA